MFIFIMSVIPFNTVAVNDSLNYKLVHVLSTDIQNRTIHADILLDLPYSDVSLLDTEDIYDIESNGTYDDLIVSDDCIIFIDSARTIFNEIEQDTFMLITIRNNVITEMQSVNRVLFQEGGVYNGILEENNPALGYVTLYFPDGSGTSPNLSTALSSYRTYSYQNIDDVTVYKDGVLSDIEQLNAGDSVFIKLDDNGYMVKISGTDNYYPVYGRVRTKGNGMLQIEVKGGDFLQIHIPRNTPIFENKRRATWDDIKQGDDVRILLQTSKNQTIIGQVTIAKREVEVDNIYKANLSSFNKFTNSIMVTGIQRFTNGVWNTIDIRGARKLTINENYYPEIPRGAFGTIYIATGKNVIGNDTVVNLVMENNSLNSAVIQDTIIDADPGRGRLILMNRNLPVSYDKSSLVLKGGKMISPNQIQSNDIAYIATSNTIDGSVKANVIYIQEPVKDTGFSLIRGRISNIDWCSSMTVESFSEFISPNWEFHNIQKTLTLDPLLTHVFDDGGRIDLPEFDDVGDESYKNRSAYILAQNGKAMFISTAPYGDVVCKGRIEELIGVQKDSFNHIVTPATAIVIRDGNCYNDELSLWELETKLQFTLNANTVFVKNGEIIDASKLEKGDSITVIKSEHADDAFVVLAESY